MKPPDPLQRPIGRLLRLAQALSPEDVVEALSTTVAELEGSDVVLYLLDYEQIHLIPLPHPRSTGEELEPLTVEGTMPGRAFASGSSLAVQREKSWQVWIPVTERAERLGVLSMQLPTWDDDVEQFCLELGLAAAYLLQSASRYSDQPERLRRVQDMSLAAEIQWGLLPPTALAVSTTTLAGLLEPAYEVGGDCFDFAINDGALDFAVFDAMGHGLSSSVLAALTVGAYRNARRQHAGEPIEQLRRMDEAVTQQYGGESFVTALLCRFEPDTGNLRWLSAGHPPPLHVRRGSVLPDADFDVGLPLGLGEYTDQGPGMVDIALEPGDSLLLYTDGVVDADAAGGEPFGLYRLGDLLERESSTPRPPEEVLRRLVLAVVNHRGTRLRDDASMVLLHWDGPPER